MDRDHEKIVLKGPRGSPIAQLNIQRDNIQIKFRVELDIMLNRLFFVLLLILSIIFLIIVIGFIVVSLFIEAIVTLSLIIGIVVASYLLIKVFIREFKVDLERNVLINKKYEVPLHAFDGIIMIYLEQTYQGRIEKIHGLMLNSVTREYQIGLFNYMDTDKYKWHSLGTEIVKKYNEFMDKNIIFLEKSQKIEPYNYNDWSFNKGWPSHDDFD